ncbi:MAG: RNA polymerase sigma factor [Fimbriiglobus sp.]
MSADEELVRRCLKGHPDATRELITRFESDVFAICLRMLRVRQDAEDAAQEVFLRIFRSLKTWDSARPLKPWVLTITVNRCRTVMLKRSKLPEPTEDLSEVPSRMKAEAAPTELTEALETALGNLRSDYREVFVLFHEQALPYDEIAEIVGRPTGTIKTWLHRARSQVLAELQQGGHVPKDWNSTPESL